MDTIEIKKKLIDISRFLIEERIKIIQNAINSAQEEANAHKGAMESRYDTFKEEAQYLRSGYEKQLEVGLKDLSIVNQLVPKYTRNIQLGSLIETLENEVGVEEDRRRVNYFVSISISNTPILVNGIEYLCVRYSSPIITELKKIKQSEEIIYHNKFIEIVKIF